MVRAKFRVTKVAETTWGGKEIHLSPEYDKSIEEDRRFSKATPSGTMIMHVDNPPAADYLKLGSYFYVYFTEVPKKEEATTAA
jgi:hypothetical protein